MSVYNREKYLCEAIESVLNQTFKDFEFIIIDDASTDGTSRLLKEYSKIDNRIILISNKKNLGLTESLDKGMRSARGEYIARMDADDICHPLRFEKQVKFLDERQDIALVGTRFNIIDENGVRINKINRSSIFPLDNETIHKTLLQYSCFCHPSIMFRKKSALSVGGFRPVLNTKYAQDYDFFLRLSESYSLYNLPEALIDYRLHKQQIRCKQLYKQHKDADIIRDEAIKRRLKKGELIDADLVRPLSWWQCVTGSPRSLGAKYLYLTQEYKTLGYHDIAGKTVFLGLFHSPFSLTMQKEFILTLLEVLFTLNQIKAIRRYMRKLRSLLKTLNIIF